MLATSRILIVEDEDILAENLRHFLARRFQEVRIAADANTTREILASYTPDVVVLDFGLPDCDGLQTYETIVRHYAPQASCVLITGHMTDHLSQAARHHGIQHMLCKPFSFNALLDMIHLSLNMAPGEAFEISAAGAAEVSLQLMSSEVGAARAPDQERRSMPNRRREDRRICLGRRQSDLWSMQPA